MLAHVVRVDLIVICAEHWAGLVTCRGPAIVDSWSVHIHQMCSLGQAPFWTHPKCLKQSPGIGAIIIPHLQVSKLRLGQFYL